MFSSSCGQFINSLSAWFPRSCICRLELSIMKLYHYSRQQELTCISASPDLDAKKLSLSGFQLVGSGLHRGSATSSLLRAYLKPQIGSLGSCVCRRQWLWFLEFDFDNILSLWLGVNKIELGKITHFLKFHVFLLSQGRIGSPKTLSDWGIGKKISLSITILV